MRADECRGYYGCARNEDGTFSPRKALCACTEKGCSSASSEYTPVPLTNGKCVKTTEKGSESMMCASFFGCTKNSDGTYSPNYAPCVCQKEGCKKKQETRQTTTEQKAQ